MTKDFRIKTKNRIKKLVREKGLKLFTVKVFLGECSESNFETVCNLLLEIWRKMYINHSSILFSHFAGFTRELIIEIDGDIIRPYLYLILFASKSNLPSLTKLHNLALFSAFKALKILELKNNLTVKDFEKLIVPLDEVSNVNYNKVLDDLMLPCIRIINPNQEIEELLKMYQYNRQLCSRGGIVSKKNLERNVSYER